MHDYDFGPDNGAELSGRRPALIISTDEFNQAYNTALVLPASRTMPAERYRNQQHVYITATDSWASTRQIKTAHQSRLGSVMGQASPSELTGAIEPLARRFTTAHRLGFILTSAGTFPIGAGRSGRSKLLR
ncbi:MAG: type II toxin-antitoxin system PemK/MazF family toxin [Chloroflexi bacterium]|nr:type II toxin-antitoxin system PemK/MazF family toxin [Chloroflexota bacterium]MYD49028.1 type II toxin-antitoxin system PemK/MazF family toxin [Chloroflexota bacterium]